MWGGWGRGISWLPGAGRRVVEEDIVGDSTDV